MSIANTVAIRRAESGEDLQKKEGCAITKNASGQLVTAQAGAASITGVVHVGGKIGQKTDYFMPAYPGVIRIKCSATPGNIAEGTKLIVDEGGTWKASADGNGLVTAQEAGEADALIEATFR